MRIENLRLLTSARLAVIAADAMLGMAVRALSNPRIGLLVVCGDNTRTTGVVSKSDIVRHLATVGLTDVPITTLMSRNVISCSPADDLYATWQRMAVQKVQNMPVLGTDSKPLGILDVRDALKTLLELEEYQERLLSNYVAGVGYQ